VNSNNVWEGARTYICLVTFAMAKGSRTSLRKFLQKRHGHTGIKL
jgi:hypothetical protein